ncbi:MAG: hypothetical protein E6J75_02215 [Deltaproteobacteria bacterium]|nr:MAG: hypothetical protein E6J75_02215 [Deltaproteobacteria bacterium]
MNDTSQRLGPPSLIAFSGLDGAGKSTQIELLCARLRAGGLEPTVVWVRGGYTPIFERVKSVVRRAGGRHVPPPGPGVRRSQALGRGWLRRLWLAAALLDLRLNFPGEQVERWWFWRAVARLTPRPDVAFLLLVPVAESERRSDLKGEPFRDSREVLSARLAHYRALALPSGCTMLDGSRPAAEIAAEIAAAVGLPVADDDAHQPAA